jgi:D-tyrosyl-tRNA(Tyr) deacylase
VRAVVQRVSEASVAVEGSVVGAIGPGLVVLLGIAEGDGEEDVAWLAGRIARMRLFADERGRFDRSLLDIGGEALVVSQFTLLASTRKGTRPDFSAAARPEAAEPLYERFRSALAEQLGREVPGGRFAAHLDLRRRNHGPVTIVIDSRLRD